MMTNEKNEEKRTLAMAAEGDMAVTHCANVLK